ncbi:hypothetical protein KP509_09G038700 [Ceratopteris richardii]|uniref:SEC1 family transport protein SLY1 n=3 Tax=Ceratopteris richardii TaxID=49495 RepID=A0A8T2U5R3_CERRI|nr:hypothetical protein KP509_09G038700 [Ceratopteris richardii]
MALSIRQRQTDAVVKMLNLNISVVSGGTADEEVYKVLILDRFCRDILSPLIRVNDLRKHGVTLFFTIDKERQVIPDVPAVYFVQPTAANVERIIRDASKGVYETFHLNFSSSIPRSLLENLAAGSLKGDCTQRISKVFDQYLEFITLEHGMFSLGQPLTYVQLNDPHAEDKDVEMTVESIVNGLFCVIVTLGVVPIICCPKGGPAEMVASQLDSRLRSHLNERNNLFMEAGHLGSSFQRPVLCIFDRNFELTAALQHVWSYRPMVHDILGMKLNRVVQGGKPYELDDSDPFWVANSSAPFPKVAEVVELELKKYKQDIEAVNRKTGAKGEMSFDEQELLGNTKHLMNAVNSLPELTERKKMIDKHTNLATALLGEIKSRSLDGFYNIEDDMLGRGSVDKNALLSVLKGKGTKEDKLRTAIVYLLAVETTPATEVEAIEGALREADIGLSSFLYVKKMKSLNSTFAAATAGNRNNLVDWAEKLYGQSLSAVTAGVKSLLSGGRQLAVTRAVEALLEARAGPETEAYLTFDPRVPKSSSKVHIQGSFKEAIVFMIGGGNYNEFLSLQELGQRLQPARNIMYGTTEVLSGKEFVEQLSTLGTKMGLGGSQGVIAPAM